MVAMVLLILIPFYRVKINGHFIACYKIEGQFLKVQVYTSAYQFFVLTIYHDTENWKQNIFVIGMHGM